MCFDHMAPLCTLVPVGHVVLFCILAPVGMVIPADKGDTVKGEMAVTPG